MIEIISEYKSVNDILLLFSFFPGKGLYRKEILEATGLSNIALDKSLMKMQNLGLCLKEKRIIKLNNTHPYINMMIEIFQRERKKLNNPSYKEYRVIKEALRKILDQWKHYKFVIFFGSRAKLIHTEESDYDIAIVFNSEQDLIQMKLSNELREVSQKFSVKIQAHYFSYKEFVAKKKARSPLIMDIIKDGMFILGNKEEII